MAFKGEGYACLYTPEGVTGEAKTFTCAHCNSIHHVRGMARPEDVGGLCKQCMALICPKCLDKGCTPFEKKLDMYEARMAARRSYGV